MTEWQSIETAPKDHSAVWILVDNHPYIGFFETITAPWKKEQWVVKATFRRRPIEDRERGLPDEIFGTYVLDVSPTHWMPLPGPRSVSTEQ